MLKFLEKHKENLSFFALGAVFLVALLNPVFKKYDYGAEYPLLLLLGLLLPFIVYAEYRKKRESNRLENILLGIFAIFTVISFAYSETRNIGFSEVLAFLEMVFLYQILSGEKLKWRKTFLKFWGILTLVVCSVAFVMFFFQAEPRMFGPFFNIFYHANNWPNAFALYLLMSWPVILLLFKKWNIFASLAVAFVLSALLLTFSRGAFLALCGQVILLLLYFWPQINKKIVLSILSVILLVFGIFNFSNYIRSLTHTTLSVQERVNFENGEEVTSKEERVDFWVGATKIAGERPLIGLGPFSFRYAYNPMQKTFLGNSDHPHNLFLKIAAEEGLIAAGALLLLLLVLAMKVLKRFSKLGITNKEEVFVLSTAALGALAHSMIDYNFNFLANILLFFLILILIRSAVVQNDRKERKAYFATILGVLITLLAIYEGAVYSLAYAVNPAYLQYSFFPRNYYLQTAEEKIAQDDIAGGLYFVTKQLDLNGLDAAGWLLKGKIYCHPDNPNMDLKLCEENYLSAIQKNPLNDFVYYKDYFKVAVLDGLDSKEREILKNATDLLAAYFDYVRQNVHFTAYTNNVEMAAETINIIIPYLPEQWAGSFEAKRAEMLEKAKILRTNKSF